MLEWIVAGSCKLSFFSKIAQWRRLLIRHRSSEAEKGLGPGLCGLAAHLSCTSGVTAILADLLPRVWERLTA